MGDQLNYLHHFKSFTNKGLLYRVGDGGDVFDPNLWGRKTRCAGLLCGDQRAHSYSLYF